MSDGFVEAAKAGELAPGRMKRVNIGGRCVLLANVAGHYYAVDDTCTHEDASLSSGFLKDDLVKCPLHGSRFNVCTGAALEEPAQMALRTYPVRLEGERILIEIHCAGMA